MSTEDTQNLSPAADTRTLSPAARRALQEAEARRKAMQEPDLPVELGGRREGLDPARYGDWEIMGRAIDF